MLFTLLGLFVGVMMSQALLVENPVVSMGMVYLYALVVVMAMRLEFDANVMYTMVTQLAYDRGYGDGYEQGLKDGKKKAIEQFSFLTVFIRKYQLACQYIEKLLQTIDCGRKLVETMFECVMPCLFEEAVTMCVQEIKTMFQNRAEWENSRVKEFFNKLFRAVEYLKNPQLFHEFLNKVQFADYLIHHGYSNIRGDLDPRIYGCVERSINHCYNRLAWNKLPELQCLSNWKCIVSKQLEMFSVSQFNVVKLAYNSVLNWGRVLSIPFHRHVKWPVVVKWGKFIEKAMTYNISLTLKKNKPLLRFQKMGKIVAKQYEFIHVHRAQRRDYSCLATLLCSFLSRVIYGMLQEHISSMKLDGNHTFIESLAPF